MKFSLVVLSVIENSPIPIDILKEDKYVYMHLTKFMKIQICIHVFQSLGYKYSFRESNNLSGNENIIFRKKM